VAYITNKSLRLLSFRSLFLDPFPQAKDILRIARALPIIVVELPNLLRIGNGRISSPYSQVRIVLDFEIEEVLIDVPLCIQGIGENPVRTLPRRMPALAVTLEP